MSSPTQIVFIVDDDANVRRTLEMFVKAMGLGSQSFDSSERFLATYAGEPGCLVLDLMMPQMDGLQLLEILRDRHSMLPVIVLSGHGNVQNAVRALKAGAADFIEKPFDPDAFKTCVLNALTLDRERRATETQQVEFEKRLASLTDSEREILARLNKGEPTKKIASNLDISLRTVQLRRASIMKKLHVKTRAELARLFS